MNETMYSRNSECDAIYNEQYPETRNTFWKSNRIVTKRITKKYRSLRYN